MKNNLILWTLHRKIYVYFNINISEVKKVFRKFEVQTIVISLRRGQREIRAVAVKKCHGYEIYLTYTTISF